MSLSLLYVEDEDFIRENAVLFLEDTFDTIYEADNAFDALILYHDKKPDIIITDISMPKMSGLAFCERVRKTDSKTPIIITTAHTNTEYLLKAVELQLVKYLVKPIDEDALIEALQLCFTKLQEDDSNIISLQGDYTYDSFNQTLFHHDKVVKLSHLETLFFKLLLRHPEHICSYAEIENYLYQDTGMSSDALRTLIKNIRKKTDKSLIQNHSKLGYKIGLS